MLDRCLYISKARLKLQQDFSCDFRPFGAADIFNTLARSRRHGGTGGLSVAVSLCARAIRVHLLEVPSFMTKWQRMEKKASGRSLYGIRGRGSFWAGRRAAGVSTIHPETETDTDTALQQIRSLGLKSRTTCSIYIYI